MTSSKRPWLLTIVGTLVVATLLYPFYWMLSASLQAGVSSANITLFPSEASLLGYLEAFASQGPNILTSLVVACGATLFALVIAAPAAYGLSRIRGRFVDVILVVVLITQMIPGIVLANSLYSIFSSLQLLNTHLALILSNGAMGIPFAILILRSFLLSLDGEILEAALLDGAGHSRTFFSIVLPLARNALITAGIFSFLGAWSDFLFALTLTTTSDVRPVTLGIYQYLGGQYSDWGQVMASSVLASIPAIVLMLLFQRQLQNGVSAGSGR